MFRIQALTEPGGLYRQKLLKAGSRNIYPWLGMEGEVNLVPRRQDGSWQTAAPSLFWTQILTIREGRSIWSLPLEICLLPLLTFLLDGSWACQSRGPNWNYQIGNRQLKFSFRVKGVVVSLSLPLLILQMQTWGQKGFCDLSKLTWWETKASLLTFSPVYFPWHNTTHESSWEGSLEL